MIAMLKRDLRTVFQPQSKLEEDEVCDIAFTCLACFSNPNILSMAFWISVWSKLSQGRASEGCVASLCNLMRVWDDFVCFFGEVILGLEDTPVRHVQLR